MANQKWFISDTHFFHSNMLKFLDDQGHKIRPFSSLEEQHEYMVKKWNDNVKYGDYVYHLGDVTFRYDGEFNNLMHRLNGSKRLIVGNHDKLKNKTLLQHFDKVMLWHGFKEADFTAVHIPLPLDRLRDGHFCVHGHTHQKVLSDPHYINMCVETRDYTPVHFDTIIQEIKKV